MIQNEEGDTKIFTHLFQNHRYIDKTLIFLFINMLFMCCELFIMPHQCPTVTTKKEGLIGVLKPYVSAFFTGETALRRFTQSPMI